MEPKKCPHCGANMNTYWQNLTPMLVETLIDFSLAAKEKSLPALHVPKDFPLPSSRYTNFQKLKYHGLIAKDNRPGYWRLTYTGICFLKGGFSIPDRVLTYRNEVIDVSSRCVTLEEVMANKEIILQENFSYAL